MGHEAQPGDDDAPPSASESDNPGEQARKDADEASPLAMHIQRETTQAHRQPDGGDSLLTGLALVARPVGKRESQSTPAAQAVMKK